MSAGPPLVGLYLKPPSAGGLCDGVITMPSPLWSVATAIIDEDGVRDDRRRCHAVVALEDRLDAFRGKDLERRPLRRSGQGMRVLAEVEGAIDPLGAAVVADRPGDRQDVRLGERIVERRAPVPTGAERDALARIARIGPIPIISLLQRGDVDQYTRRSQLTCQGMNRHRIPPLSLIHRTWFDFPDVAGVLGDRAVAGELAGMSHVQDRPARPGIGLDVK